ncbi:CCCH-type zinc finger protein moe-3 [Linum grandiflorum]
MDSPMIRYFRGAATGARSPTIQSQHDFDGVDAENAFRSPSPMAKNIQFSSSSGGKNRGVTSIGRMLSPLSSLENVMKSSVFAATPLKVMEDDVLVMNEIGVVPAVGGARASSKTRVLSESVGSLSNSSSSSSSVNGINKTELCRAWVDHGYCRYATKCQFAHGKEELRPPGLTVKNKSDVNMVGSYRSLTPPSYPRDTKSLFVSPVMRKAAATGSERRFAADGREHTNKAIFMKSELSSKNTKSSAVLEYKAINPILVLHGSSSTSIKKPQGFGNTSTSSSNWSPLDDNIEIILPPHTDKCSSRENIDAYINRILYGPSTRRRLPSWIQ